jgi:TDG/mug DNA glycosylase family protein
MLPDVLDFNLKAVFCGTAAGPTSARIQQYYAGQDNKFWPTLYETGLTQVRLYPPDFKEVLIYKLGLTDLVKNKAGMDFILQKSDFGNDRLVEIIKEYKPKFIAFNGKRAAKEFLIRNVNYGLQSEKNGSTQFYVLPSTSEKADDCWDISYWHELAKTINMEKAGG